jgi:hypothetical protein
MNHRFGVLGIVVLLGFTLSAQNIKAKADSLYQAKNFSAAAPLYVWAASLTEFQTSRAGNYYDAACCFALSNQPDSAFAYLEKAKEQGWNNKTHLLKDGDPADLGYWVGYMICKSYYDNAGDKKQAVYDILNVQDYKAFYEKTKVDDLFARSF